MPLNHIGPTPGESPARISPAQRRGGSISAQVGAVEVLTLADRVKVEREGPWIRVTLTRRKRRQFSLSGDEAAYLHAQLGNFVPAVVVSRVEGRAARP